MPKATNGAKKLRVKAVYDMLIMDTPRPEIIEYARNTWGVQRASADKYIRWANDIIESEAALMQSEAFVQAVAKLKAMRFNALKDGDKRLAFDILRDLNKLLNLYPAKESKVQNLDIDLLQLTDNQLQRIASGEDAIAVMTSEK